MQSILMMAVLTSASTAPEQYRYVYYGPCGTVYASPWVYYPVERVVAVEQVSAPGAAERRAVIQKKLDELTGMINRINDRLDAADQRFQAMEQKHRELAQSFDRKLDSRIKEERVRQELETVKEKTRFLEYSAKLMGNRQQGQARLEEMQQQLQKLEGQLKRVEHTLKNMTTGIRNSEATLSEASEAQEDVPDNRAIILVNLPDNARLFVNGKLRKGNARQRVILTPQLDDGEHFFTVRVETQRNGQIQSQTRQIPIRRGMQVRVTFEP